MYIVFEKTNNPNTFKFITAVPLKRPKNPDGTWAMSGSTWNDKIMKGRYLSMEITINGEKRTVIIPQ